PGSLDRWERACRKWSCASTCPRRSPDSSTPSPPPPSACCRTPPSSESSAAAESGTSRCATGIRNTTTPSCSPPSPSSSSSFWPCKVSDTGSLTVSITASHHHHHRNEKWNLCFPYPPLAVSSLPQPLPCCSRGARAHPPPMTARTPPPTRRKLTP